FFEFVFFPFSFYINPPLFNLIYLCYFILVYLSNKICCTLKIRSYEFPFSIQNTNQNRSTMKDEKTYALSKHEDDNTISRRTFLRYAGSLAAFTGASAVLPGYALAGF